MIGKPWPKLSIHSTAYEGELYRGQVKTDASRSAIPIPDDIIPIVEAWRQVCPDSVIRRAHVPNFRARRTQRSEGAAPGKELPQVANLTHRRQTEDPEKADHVSGDAANSGHGSSEARDNEGRTGSLAARHHQNNCERVHAGDTGQCESCHQLSDARSFGQAAGGRSKT